MNTSKKEVTKILSDPKFWRDMHIGLLNSLYAPIEKGQIVDDCIVVKKLKKEWYK